MGRKLSSYRAELSKLIIKLKPYAFVTIQTNSGGGFAGAPASRSAIKLEEALKQLMLRLDHEYFKSKFVTQIQTKYRFNAVYFFEKMDRSPHLHMLMFIEPKYAEELSETELENEIVRQKLCLLQHLPTSDAELCAADVEFLKTHADPGFVRSGSLMKSTLKQASCHVGSVHDAPGLARYITKEAELRNWRSGEAFNFTSKFNSLRGDKKPPHKALTPAI